MTASEVPAVLARARQGDSEAFRLLVERHSRGAFRLAFRMRCSAMASNGFVRTPGSRDMITLSADPAEHECAGQLEGSGASGSGSRTRPIWMPPSRQSRLQVGGSSSAANAPQAMPLHTSRIPTAI